MSLYDLVVDGVAMLYARQPGLLRYQARQPLAGLADGTNLVFQTPLYPVLSTISVYLGGTLQLASAYTLDAAAGTVTFVTAPTVQPTANYTAVGASTQQAVYYAWAGFLLMETVYRRGYSLSNSLSAYALASPTDAHIYVVDGHTVSDPAAGTATFSTSIFQRGFLERCTHYAYLDAMASEAALSDVDVTQRAGGIAIRTAHRSPNILRAKEALWNELLKARDEALDEADPTGAHYGGAVTQIHSNFYTSILHWQNDNGLVVPMSEVGMLLS